MQITITFQDASDDDCRRVDYVTVVDGQEHCLSACALGNEYSDREAENRARQLWGNDIEISYSIH